MRVLKIVAEGITTSFRYPHFMQQIHPSFQMPPPATIYGHICSAVGEWVNPTGLQFAYHFTYHGVTSDLEHIIVAGPGKGKFEIGGKKYVEVLRGTMNPFERELLFNPRLTLYLNRPEWVNHFRSPRYAVVLGRSQDLFTYTQVEVIELTQAEQAYFEHTIVPYEWAVKVQQGVTVLLPRYLDYEQNRDPYFSRYLVVRERVFSQNFLIYDAAAQQDYWIDPRSPTVKKAQLGLCFHSFTGDDGETLNMA
ncbi:MAG: type I-B CRISPR-associated protein Cas5 [Anaerolineales bacterium]|nr:type I-B CRISPR-associated protein Cas5 [Anaerolineales bacterium]